MARVTPQVGIWISSVAALAAAATVAAVSLTSNAPSGLEWLALAVLAACAGVAHVFPIRSASEGVSYRMTNVLVVAGAVLVPASLLTGLAALAVAPDLWLRRHRRRWLIGWLFNASQTALAAHAAAAWLRWTGTQEASGAFELLALIGAAAIFTVVQAFLVGVVVSLDSGTRITRAFTFASPALLGDCLNGILGIAVAGMWLAEPLLVALVGPIMLLAHHVTRDAHLARLADVEPNTGLHTYQRFEQALGRELSGSRRGGRPLAILMADIDRLRDINERHGRAAGDLVVRGVATRLSQALRKGDIVAHFGSEEFVALLPGTDAEEALYLAEQARMAVADSAFRLDDGTEVSCTVSLGMAACPVDGVALPALLGQARAALSEAKQTRDAVGRIRSLPVRPQVQSMESSSQPDANAARGRAPQFGRASALLWGTVAGGLLAIAWSLVAVHQADGWARVLPLAIIAAASEFVKVRIYETNRQVLSFSFTVVAVMLAVTSMPEAAPVVALAAATVHVLAARQRKLEKILFNLANLPLAGGLATLAFLAPHPRPLPDWNLVGGIMAVLVYHATNVGIVSAMISLRARRPLLDVVRESAWCAPALLFLGLTGAFLGPVYTQVGLIGAAMFAVPLLVLRFTLVFYVQRSARTIDKLETLNRLLEAENGRRLAAERERASLLEREQLARSQAEAAVGLRDEFLSVAAHELKTPITSLRGYAQLITRDISEQGASDPSRLSRALTRIDEQSGKLARLVAQLLDISRIDSGKLALERRPTDVAQLARGVAATIQAQSTDHLLKVRNTSPLLASIDPLRFEQVLVNLVGNAVKYSPNGGEINIDVSAVGTSSVVVAVRDHGIGIPHERRMHIFDRFYQAHGEGHFGGMGLGLYISRQIVEMHGARIEAEFPADGGTCFVVSLPAAAAVQDKAPRLRSDLGAVLAGPAQRRPAAAQLVGVA